VNKILLFITIIVCFLLIVSVYPLINSSQVSDDNIPVIETIYIYEPTFADELKNISQVDITLPKYRNWRSATEFVNYKNPELATLICKYYDTPEDWIFYVQNIPYLHETSENWQTPLETIITYTGDCEDCSLLINFGLRSMGYDAGIALFSGHAIAVIAGNYSGKYFVYDNTNYYAIESGITYPIGSVMPLYANDSAQLYF